MVVAPEVSECLASHQHLAAARELSLRRIREGREILAPHRQDNLDIVAFGSLARLEATAESDFDHLVLATGLPVGSDDALLLLDAADNLRTQWATEDASGKAGAVNKPGASGVFGCAVGAFDLVHQIGLQEDTNHSLTRRMLLLEESVSLLDQAVHRSVMEATLSRYLELDGSQPNRVPRFLLNDVTRYWHTITVDYQAKARVGVNESGLRYIKLIIPRKILFAGTVMSLLLCGKPGRHCATTADLLGQFAMTPLERLVQAMPDADEPIKEAMRGIIDIADFYLSKSKDKEWRETIKRASKTARCTEFDEMRDRANELQKFLETIFFDWSLISDDSRRMLVF